MSGTLAQAGERSVLVDATEQQQASALLDVLGNSSEQLHLEGNGRTVPLPPELSAVLTRVIEVVANGGTVTIGSLPEELTTTMAAEQLGISRPTLMKMIKRNEIPAYKVGSHHRLRLTDVLEAKRARLARQKQAFDELRELSEQLDEG